MKQEKNQCAGGAVAEQAAKDAEFMRKALIEAETARDLSLIHI